MLIAAATPVRAAPLKIEPGDHLCIIGNTLADRMQHDGWLETYLQARFPGHELVIRNLGFSGDELTQRLRSAAFGSPDEHLTFNKASVVFAFFGYNESFGGEERLERFKSDLAEFLRHTRSQKYNGREAPRLVVFSPIAHEDLGDQNLPDGRANNRRLELYARAMREIAAKEGVVFVDLFAPTRDLYAKEADPLTINGVHLNERGNRLLAGIIDQALFGDPPRALADDEYVRELRAAVLDKNFHWYNRYRTVDGYSIFGGRADLRFVDGQTNRVVMQREMEVLDVMTANRDKRIWAVAQGRELSVDDSNTPPFLPVRTNKPGDGPGGKHLFLSGEEAIAKMTVGKGMKVNLVASEERFPELISPVQMSFDPKGRLWVAVWPSYPHWRPKEAMNDKLLIVEDDDGDGRADRIKTFADGLHNPTGFEFWRGGVLVAMAPDLLYLKDTDGDDRADLRVRVLSGLDTADTHHAANSFTFDPGGALYFQEGTFHHTQVETPWGPPVRCANAGVFRFEPRTFKFEVYVTYGFANPHGHVFDRWGQDFIYDGTGANPYHAALFSGRLHYPNKHPQPPQVYPQRTRPCPGVEILSSRHFPDEMQGNLLVGNVIGFQGLLQYKLADKGASFTAQEVEPIFSSTDPNFRPADFEIGPDGAIWFCDWQNPIIGHMQHNLRDPSRDREHGRIYRVTYPGRPLLRSPAIAGEPIEKLLDVLRTPEDRVRYRARIELGGRPTEAVMQALDAWVAGLDPNDPEFQHLLLEGLWLRANHNVVDEALLDRVLASPDFRARAAATRVLCYWRDRVPSSIEKLLRRATDEHPRVRLEAVRAASFFDDPAAIRIVLAAATRPSDEYLDYVRGETMRALGPVFQEALREGRDLALGDDAAARVLLANVPSAELLRAKRTHIVCLELLERPGLRDELRREILLELSGLEKRPPLPILLDSLRAIDAAPQARAESVFFDLARLLFSFEPAELAGHRAEFERLAKSGAQPLARQLAFAALITADGTPEGAWSLASISPRMLRDAAGATPFLRDVALRQQMLPLLLPLLEGLPAGLASDSKASKGTVGRYVRIELPRRGTLTLAEVEVLSDRRNVARNGKASQKTTAFGGDASKAIDGNTSGGYGAGGQTHTREDIARPWWEVDLGAETPIEAVLVHNRTDGDLGKRLDGYTLQILDRSRQPVFERSGLPAPDPVATIRLGEGDPADLVRRAAMNALVSIPGKEKEAFSAIAGFVKNGVDRGTAMHALLAIPVKSWPKDEALPLLGSVLSFLKETPVAERTSPAAADAMQLGESLAALLPAEEALRVRRELRELGVRVLRLATLPDRMLFDKDLLVVQAARPFEIVFENTDIMPHNFVLATPGSLAEVGGLGEAQATEPGAAERQYVPVSRKILASSRLLQPRDAQRLQLTAPSEPGVYPYVCTYPGHWRRMYGALIVVADLEAYLADPSAYVASHPLAAKDELLQSTRPRQEWTMADLVPYLEQLSQGRSFQAGKQIFQAANCVACHRLNDVGYEIGPDLAKLDPKLGPADILKNILEPSAAVNEKYASTILELDSGEVVTGVVVEETPEALKLVENPLAKSAPRSVSKAEILARKKSPTSIMPLGLVDRLTREEILDLIAYLAARGNPHHPLFSTSHHGH